MSKSAIYICTQAFATTLHDGDVWFKAGQRARGDHEVFEGESGKNRQRVLFREAEPADLVGAEK